MLASGATELDLAALVCARVHDHFAYEWGVTTVETTAAEAWAEARGVCQDYAHCMVALCRLCGLPARYVSGHLLGDGGTHAWVEVLVRDDASGEVRAVPFDPTHDRRAGPRYVTVAVGRDYGDVPPTSGTFEGLYAGELTTHKRAAVVRVEYLQPVRRRRVTAADATAPQQGVEPRQVAGAEPGAPAPLEYERDRDDDQGSRLVSQSSNVAGRPRSRRHGRSAAVVGLKVPPRAAVEEEQAHDRCAVDLKRRCARNPVTRLGLRLRRGPSGTRRVGLGRAQRVDAQRIGGTTRRAQARGKLRLRATPASFCRVPHTQAVGYNGHPGRWLPGTRS